MTAEQALPDASPARTSPRIVLFGSAGFIGRHVLTALEARGLTVTPMTHDQVDLADAEAVSAALRSGDIVVNAAGYPAATDTSPEGLQRLERSNIEGVRNLADAAATVGTEQLIHVSSIAAMGRLSGHGITESDRGPIQSPYADSKRVGEEILATYGDRIAVTVLRPTYVFGEGRTLLSTLCRAAALPLVPLPSGGHALIPFSYVANIAHAISLTVAAPACFGRTFIIGDARSYSLREIIVALADAMDRHPRLIGVPLPIAKAGTAVVERLFRLAGKTPILDATRLGTMTTSVSYALDAFVDATGYQQPVDLQGSASRMARWYLSADRELRGT